MYYGTGQLARVFQVAPRTVAKWIDCGILQGLRIPGSRHRRVARAEVLRFAGEHGLPVGEADLQSVKRRRKIAIMPE